MSTLKADTIQNTSGGAVTLTNQQAAKALCNLDGTGTIAIRASFNISSVTDNATAKYVHSFTNSFTDVNNITAGLNNQANNNNNNNRYVSLPGYASASQVETWGIRGDNLAQEDSEFLQIVTHGDLA